VDLVLVAEDELSMAVLRRLLADTGRDFGVTNAIITRGVDVIRMRVPVYLNACRAVPHIVLVDLDRAPCAGDLIDGWGLARAPESLMFRVVVRTVEAWLLADAEGLAEQLQVACVKVPAKPELLEQPKQALVNLARASRKHRIRDEIAPGPDSRSKVGPYYNARLCDFVSQRWSPRRAAEQAPSLAKAMRRLDEFLR
jgi:hypothetical protein